MPVCAFANGREQLICTVSAQIRTFSGKIAWRLLTVGAIGSGVLVWGCVRVSPAVLSDAQKQVVLCNASPLHLFTDQGSPACLVSLQRE